MNYGIFDPKNNTFSGMLGAVQSGEFEASLNPLVYSNDRNEIFDFTQYIAIDPISVILPYPVLKPNVAGFLYPFTWQTWISVISGFFVVSLFHFTYSKYGRYIEDSKPTKYTSMSTIENIFRSLYVSFEAIMGQDIYNRRTGDNRLKIRILLGTWLLMAFIISLSYRCTLISMLVRPTMVVAFNSFEEMVHQKDIKYFINKGTVIQEVLEASLPESLFGRINSGRIKAPPHYTPYFQQKKYALIGSRISNMGLIHQYYKNEECLLTFMKETSDYIRVFGLFFHKGSTYRHYFDEIIARFLESGLWSYLERLQLFNVQNCVGKIETGHTDRALSLKDFYGIFLLYLAGMILACFSVILEVLYFHYKKSNKFNHNQLTYN